MTALIFFIHSGSVLHIIHKCSYLKVELIRNFMTFWNFLDVNNVNCMSTIYIYLFIYIYMHIVIWNGRTFKRNNIGRAKRSWKHINHCWAISALHSLSTNICLFLGQKVYNRPWAERKL